MTEINTNNIFKRGISFLLAICMLLSPSYMEFLAEAVGEEGGTLLQNYEVSFTSVYNGSTDLRPANDGDEKNDPFYMIAKRDTIQAATRIAFDAQSGIHPDIYELTLNLPYLYYNNEGILAATYRFNDIPEALRQSGEYMGIQARLADQGDFGSSIQEIREQTYEEGTDEDKVTWARGKLRIVHNHVPKPDSFNNGQATPTFFIQFYDGNGVIVPENAAASIMMDFSCSQYRDADGKFVPSNWSTTDSADDEADRRSRRLTFVNSNLIWETSIDCVPSVQLKDNDEAKINPVMWDKYNYMVYELKIKNTSKEKESVVDNFQINVEAQYNFSGYKTVLDKDIMQWIYKDGAVTENNDINKDVYEKNNFIGKPNEGGVLIYDVTDLPNWKEDWDLETFSNIDASPMSYGYAGSGLIIVCDEAKDDSHAIYNPSAAEERNNSSADGKKYYSERTYMVAIPYPNNFNGSPSVGFDNTTKVISTVIFGGGSSIHWSKEDTDTSEFTKADRDNLFQNHKYVKDSDGNEVSSKTTGIGTVNEYYIDGFNSVGNVPVFNAVTTDTVPEYFGLQEIEVRLDNSPQFKDAQLSDWFKVNGGVINEFIEFGFTNADEEVVYKTAKELGLDLTLSSDTTAETEGEAGYREGSKTWNLKIGSALDDKDGLTFNNEVRFVFKERINRFRTFNGLITMRGKFPYLWTYENTIKTDYDFKYFVPKTSGGKEHYESEHRVTESESATIETENANPVVTAIGVFYDPIYKTTDMGNPQSVSLNDNTAAARFVITNDSNSEITPANMTISNLYPGDAYTRGGLVASKIIISKNLLLNSKLNSITLRGFDSKDNEAEVKLALANYVSIDNDGNITAKGGAMLEDGNLVIPPARWNTKIKYLLNAELKFDTVKSHITFAKDETGADDINSDDNCFIQINGTPTTESDIEVNALLSTDYSFDGNELTDDIFEDTAILKVSKIIPVIDSSVHYKDADGNEHSANIKRVTDGYGNVITTYPTLTVPNKSETEDTWYRFTLKNDSKSTATQSLMDITLDSVGNPPVESLEKLEGFDARKIEFDEYVKGSEITAIIDKIQIFDWNNQTYTEDLDKAKPDFVATLDELTVDDGKVYLTVPDSIKRVKKIRIIFSRIHGNRDLSKLNELDVNVYGHTDWIGELKASVYFEVVGSINEASRTNSEATMSVAKTNIKIPATANRGEKSKNKLTVPNKAKDLFYNFVLENDSISKVGPANVDISIDSVGVKATKDGAEIVKGYKSKKVTISENYALSGTIDHIELYEFGKTVGTDEPTISLTLEELKKSYTEADGSFAIDLSGKMDYLANIRIVYTDMERSLTAEKGNAVSVGVYGESDWFDDLTATAEVTPLHKLMADQKKSGNATFHVDRPYLSVNAHIFYNNIKETTQSSGISTDKNETITGVPYDRDFMYRAEFGNYTISVLDDVQIISDVPFEEHKEAGTGFHTTKLMIYKDLIDQFGSVDNIKLTGKNAANSASVDVVLLPKKADGKIVGFYREGHEDTVFEYDSDKSLSFTDEQLLDNFGIKTLTCVEMNGKKVKIADNSEENTEKRYIEFYGYDDTIFGKTDTLVVNTNNYLDCFRESEGYNVAEFDADKYIVNAKDMTSAYISKMYFDTTVMAFYNDGKTTTPGGKYTAASTPLEHIRKNYAQSDSDINHGHYSYGDVHWHDAFLFSEYAAWGESADNSELEIGYKAIGSFAVDFRQFKNVGSNLPKANSYYSQEHQGISYVHNESLNTAATVDLSLDLPSDTFDAYYMKIDPRAKDYINYITVTYKDGTSYKIDGKNIKYEAAEQLDGANFARINLINVDGKSATMFSPNDKYYYIKPSAYGENPPKNPITNVVVNIDINQDQTLEDGETAASPDYGIWYDQTDSSTQGMFEVTGRFYKMDGAIATASAEVTVGNKTNGRSKERTDKGSSSKTKSDWSFWNKYSSWTGPYHNYSHNWHWTNNPIEYTARDLYSQTRVHIVTDKDSVLKGVGETPDVPENLHAHFANDNSYAISFYRRGYMKQSELPTGYIYNRAPYANNEYHWPVAGGVVRADQYDWVDKLSYTDKVVLSDTLPVIYPDATYDYHGFLTTGLEIKKEIYDYFDDNDKIKLTLQSKGEKNANLSAAKTVEIPVSELKKLYGTTDNWFINFNYDKNIKEEDPDDGKIVYPDPDPTKDPTFVMCKIVSEQGKAVSGAEFGLFKKGEADAAYKAVSDKDGFVQFSGVESGTYTVKQTKELAGYVTNETAYEVPEVTGDNMSVTLNDVIKLKIIPSYIGESEYPEIQSSEEPAIIGKITGSDGAALKNVNVGLFEKNNALNPVTIVSTDSSGFFVFTNVPNGEYFVMQTGTAAGYEKSTEKYEVTLDNPVDADTTVTYPEITISDGTEGSTGYQPSVIMGKAMDNEGNALSGVEFGLYDTAGNQLLTSNTDADGFFIFSGIADGTYNVKQISAVDGCVQNTDVYNVTVASSEDNKLFTIGDYAVVNRRETSSKDYVGIIKIDHAFVNTAEENGDGQGSTVEKPEYNAGYTVDKSDGTYTVVMEENTYVIGYEMAMYDIPGTADYSKELTDKTEADYHDNGSWDILVHGKPYVINKVDEKVDGTNTAHTEVFTDYDPNAPVYNMSDDAVIMGYLISFKGGYTITTKNDSNSQNIYDFVQKKSDGTYDNITPENGLFKVKLFNQNKNNATGEDAAARIDSMATVNTMDANYRLRHIYIPAFLIDGKWFGIESLTINANGKKIPVKVVKGTGENGLDDDGNYVFHVNETKSVQGEDVYSVDVEDIIRKLGSEYTTTYTNPSNGKTYLKAFVSSFDLNLRAVKADRTKPETVLGDGEYLSATKKNDKCSFMYDGAYADRTEENFDNYKWDYTSNPTVGKIPNGYSSTNAYSKLSVTFTSCDPNANVFEYKNTDGTAKGNVKSAYYNVKNLLGTLVVDVTRNKIYDSDDIIPEMISADLSVDYLHLMPYDYVEYRLTAGADNNSLIPVEHTDISFTVPAGQRIVKWVVETDKGKILAASEKASENIVAGDITAKLSDGTNTINAQQNVDYTLTAFDGAAAATETKFTTLNVSLGSGKKNFDRIMPGEKIYVRVITQLTDNNGDFDGKTTADATVAFQSAPCHTYPQYYIDNTNSSVSSTSRYRYTNDMAGVTDYFRYTYKDTDSQIQYKSVAKNKLTFQSVEPVKLTYTVDNIAENYDGKPSKLTVSGITNETGHYCNEYEVSVSFIEKRDSGFYRGFELTKPYTVQPNANFSHVEVLYAVANTNTAAPDENINFKLDSNGEIEVEWKSYEYDPATSRYATALMTDADLPNVVGVKWIYYDLKGFDTTEKYSSTSKAVLPLDNVVLTGVGRYQDIFDHSKKKNDTYTQYFTADNKYTHIHTENKNAVTVTDEGSTVATAETMVLHSVQIKDERVSNPSVYRENPIASFHTQTFATEGSAADTYDISKAQKKGYRPNDEIWQKVTLKNNLAVKDKNGNQAGEEGRLIDPVFYDKVPEYFASTLYDEYKAGDSLDKFGVRLVNRKGEEQNLEELGLELYLVGTTDVTDYDYGGKMTYTDGYLTGNATRKVFSDLKPSTDNTYKINFKIYEVKLRYKDDPDEKFVLMPGERIEFWYNAKVRQNDLPMVYTASTFGENGKASLVGSDGLHPAYFPRIGEYWQQRVYHYYNSSEYGNLYPLISGGFSDTSNPFANFKQVQNSGILMDMDFLVHDIGFSAEKNTQVDMWEFLDQSSTVIPGTSSTNSALGGQNNTLIDEDVSTANNMQSVKYTANRTVENSDDLDKLPTSVTYVSSSKNRDWFSLAMGKRNANHADWISREVPVVWSETRMHMQKAWLATSSEFTSSDTSGNIQYELTQGDYTGDVSNPDYPSHRTWNYGSINGYYNNSDKITDRSGAVALEYGENVNVNLSAYNYGDWNLDGVTFIYTFAYGMKPVFNDDGTTIDVKAFTNTGLSNSNSFAEIGADNIEVELIQTPETTDPKYFAPKKMRDPEQNQSMSDELTDFYTADEYVPYVVKVTVKHPLKKWFGRGGNFNYITKVTIPARIFTNTEVGYWYDRVLTVPYVRENSENHYYYQIYDIDHWDGSTKTGTQHNQIYGMDYLWNPLYWYYSYTGKVQADSLIYGAASPNTPSVNGYNIQNKEVVVSDSNAMGKFTNNITDDMVDYSNADVRNIYAETGTRAIQRKPLVRTWTTISESVGNNNDEMYGTEVEQYYTETQGEVNWLNIHVENKYWWDQYAVNTYTSEYYIREKPVHNYNVDGGQKGTLSLPVITNVLPYGIVPVAEDGNRFTTNNTENEGKKVCWEMYDRDLNKLDDQKSLYDTLAYYDETTKRYVVQIFAKMDNDTSAKSTKSELEQRRKDEAVIPNDALYNFCIRTFTYAEPETDTKDGEETDLSQNYQNNYSYVSSKVNAYKFIIDDDIAGNPYTVCSRAAIDVLRNYYYDNFHYRGADARKDAVKRDIRVKYDGRNSYFYNNAGTLPMTPATNGDTTNSIVPDKYVLLNHKFENNTYMLGKMKKYNESDEMNMEDYPEIRDSVYLPGNVKSALNRDTDIFTDATDFIHSDITAAGPFNDMGVVNTLKIRTQTPSMKVENMVAAEKTEEGLTGGAVGMDETENRQKYQYNGKDFDYSDVLWYSAKISNVPDDNYRFRGSIFHAKTVVSFQLPQNVIYWDDDDYLDDYYIEYVNKRTGETDKLTMAEAKAKGWGVELVKRSFDENVATADNTDLSLERANSAQKRGCQTVVFEITTPKSDGFDDHDDKTYVSGEKPAGSFYGELTFKIKTRIDNLEVMADASQQGDWDNYYSKVYVTYCDTDGKFAITKDGIFAERDDDGNYFTRGGCLIPKVDEHGNKVYNEYGNLVYVEKQRQQVDKDDIAYDTYDFNLSEQKMHGMKLANSVEYDETNDISGVAASDYGIYMTASSAKVSVIQPKGTVRLNLNATRTRVNDPDAELVIAEDPHVRQSFDTVAYLSQVSNDTTALNEFVVNYNLAYHATLTGGLEEATLSDTPVFPHLQFMTTGSWSIPSAEDLTTEYGDKYKELVHTVLSKHLRVYPYLLVSPAPEDESAYIYPETSADDGIYANSNPDATAYWVRIGDDKGYALDANQQLKIAKESFTNSALEKVPDNISSICCGETLTKSVRQIRWVIRTEGFDEEFELDGEKIRITLTDEEAGKYFPVPVGLRMNVDADPDQDGIQEMNDIDPKNYSLDPVPESVAENSAKIQFTTRPETDQTLPASVHNNHFASKSFCFYNKKI